MTTLTRILTGAIIAGFLLYGGAIALLVGAAFSVFAGEPCAWAVATVASEHINPPAGSNYNQRNWGLGGEHCIGRLGALEIRGAAGFFRNSNRIDSFYWGGSASVPIARPVHVGVALLQVSGYEIDPITAVLPVLAVEGRHVGANLSYLPKFGGNVSAIGLQLKWRWR